MSNALDVTTATFDASVLKSAKPVLVDFWATWCQPCRAMAPIIDSVATAEAARLDVAKVDVDSSPELAEKFGVMSIPTLILFKNGVAVERMVGLVQKDALVKKLTPHL